MAKTRQQLAQDAIRAQDACNPSGVAHLLMEAFELLSQEDADTKTKCEDPAVRLIVHKLHDLCGFQGELSDWKIFSSAYEALKKMAKS